MFTLSGLGERTMTAALPVGSSGTGLDGSQVVACGLAPSRGGSVRRSARSPSCSADPPLRDRRRCRFSDKIRNARLQGAIGVLLYNHRYGDSATAGAILDSISLGTGQPVPVVGLAAGDWRIPR